MRTTISLLVTAALATGCYTQGSVGYRATATVSAPAPSLVYVSPGVQVVEDYDYPVFYSEGAYWRYDGGVWYRSRVHTGGWVVTRNVPVVVRRIDRPTAYVHFHAKGRAVVKRDHRR